MWHFGPHSPDEYAGAKFEVAWKGGGKCLDAHTHKRPGWRD